MVVSDQYARDLAKYAKGWTIVDVQVSERSEAWWKLTLRRGERKRTLHLAATDLGAWVEGVKDEGGTHLKFDAMVNEMTDHICEKLDDFDLEEVEQLSFEVLANESDGELGFRCPLTGKVFMSSFEAANESTFKERLQTREGRERFASDVWNMKGVW